MPVRGNPGGVIGGVVGAGVGAAGFGLLGNPVDESPNYGPGFLAAHEGTHNIEDFALTPDQRRRLEALYQSRKTASGPWLASADYTSSTIHEYFANSASAYFSTPYESQYASSYTPEWLKTNDPGMYDLLREIFNTRQPGTRNDTLEMRYRASAAA